MCDSGWAHFILTCDWLLEGLVLLKSEYLFFCGVQMHERKWAYSSLTCRGQQNIRGNKRDSNIVWDFCLSFVPTFFFYHYFVHISLMHTHTHTHAALLYLTCLDSKQCMMKTSAPCRLLRIVKIYTTAMGPSSNMKAPNTHIRPSIHIWAIAVTVKALQTELGWRVVGSQRRGQQIESESKD